MRVLFDTNVMEAVLAGDPAVGNLMRHSEALLMSVIVVGELIQGFRKGSKFEANIARLDILLSKPRVELIPVTRETAERYGAIAASLRRRGRPIPTNDVWIAAHALETGAALVSRDAHFEEVENILLIRPGRDD